MREQERQMISREECRELWEGNKRYAEQMGDDLNIGEAVLLAKKQDALYLAWCDGNFSALMIKPPEY